MLSIRPYVKRILFLAPQPFFQERGTPIAVRLAVEALTSSGKYEVTLLTYHEGFDVAIQGVTHKRMWAPKWLYGIRPGISIKKLVADFLFFFSGFRLLAHESFDFIHAVEESIYMALPFGKLRKIPVIYDMDSSLTEQITESWKSIKFLKPVIHFFEDAALRNSTGVLAVCDALKEIALRAKARHVSLLYDISLLSEQNEATKELLRETIHSENDSKIILYVGNLEGYQGIDLLLLSFASLLTSFNGIVKPSLIILGGSERHIEKYSNMALRLGISEHVFLLGPRPLSMLGSYLSQATILVSPRTKGNNTPMKVYSYLDSGIPMVATDLTTHTQAVSANEAFLAPAVPDEFAKALNEALTNPNEAKKRGENAKLLVQQKYSKSAFKSSLLGFYESI